MPTRVGYLGVAVATDGDLTASWRCQAHHDAHRRGLTGAIGPQEASDAPRLAGEGHIIDSSETAVGLGQTVPTLRLLLEYVYPPNG